MVGMLKTRKILTGATPTAKWSNTYRTYIKTGGLQKARKDFQMVKPENVILQKLPNGVCFSSSNLC